MHGLRWFSWGDETSKINDSGERKRESDSEREQAREGAETVRGFLMTQMIAVYTLHTGVHVCMCVCVVEYTYVCVHVCVCICVCPTVALTGAGALTTTSSIFSRTSCILLPPLPTSLPAASARCLCCLLLMMIVGEWRNSITLRLSRKIDKPSRAECTR